MRVFLVTYQLRPVREHPALLQALQKTGIWMHYIDYTWLIATNETALELFDRISVLLTKADSELIIEIKRGSQYRGWLPQDAWDWVQKWIGEPEGSPYPR